MTGKPRRTVQLPNYSTEEGACRCGCGKQITDDLATTLQAFCNVLSRVYGAQVRHLITSGARCAAHNAETPGASTTSKHLDGLAADGIFEYLHRGKWQRIDTADVAAAAVKSGLFGGVGYRQYLRAGQQFVHLDLRPGPTVTW